MSGTRSISYFYACYIAKPLTGYLAVGLFATFAILLFLSPHPRIEGTGH